MLDFSMMKMICILYFHNRIWALLSVFSILLAVNFSLCFLPKYEYLSKNCETAQALAGRMYHSDVTMDGKGCCVYLSV